MYKKIHKLLGKAVCGDSTACLKLGLFFWNRKGPGRDKQLAMIFLKRSMELGNENGYFIYHKCFSKGKKIIDDTSYQEMLKEYKHARDKKNVKKIKRLRQYLLLGTNRQKKSARLYLSSPIRLSVPPESRQASHKCVAYAARSQTAMPMLLLSRSAAICRRGTKHNTKTFIYPHEQTARCQGKDNLYIQSCKTRKSVCGL